MARVHDDVIEIEDASDNEDGNVPPDKNILIAIHAKNNHIFQHNSLRQEMNYTHFIVTMPPANVTNLPLSNNSRDDIILQVAAEIRVRGVVPSLKYKSCFYVKTYIRNQYQFLHIIRYKQVSYRQN